MALELKVLNMAREAGSDGIITVIWAAGKLKAGKYYRRFGSSVFTPNPADPSFVPFASLTEATVLGWLNTAAEQAALAAIESSIDADVSAGTNTVTFGLPW
jgi:hypothetical protein